MVKRLHGVDEPHDSDHAGWEGKNEAIRLPAPCDPHTRCDAPDTGDDRLTDIALRSGKPAASIQSESVSGIPFLVISALAFFLSVAVVAISALVSRTNVETAVDGAGHDESLRPVETRNIDLGRIGGVAFYTVEQDNYRLVISLQALETGTPLRFVTTLAPEQQVTLAVPQADGENAVEVNFVRHGERVDVHATSLARRPETPSD